ncbi:type III-B CRISPR module RAMP protein Cmr6 [Caldanaerobacter sp.]|uniref:type III-B CRISPR module RAMP protein Cmr6 n=1 Tax=Caldanaerobacter sp. TaxID=2930036 RepID=UPI003C74A4DC
MIPLYQEVHDIKLWGKYQKNFNTGLWYDKFFHKWEKDWRRGEDGKKEWIQSVTSDVIGDPSLILEAITRLLSLVTTLGGSYMCYKTQWRFVTGLGREHPVENGFVWHHTLGVPYLPGSSFKGLIRSWAEEWGGVKPEEIERIFGAKGKSRFDKAGNVIFFDVLPIKAIKLEADVMTPHYSPYYLQEKSKIEKTPGDWYDPVPIPFLAVAPEQTFVFAIAPRVKEGEEDMVKLQEWIKEALNWAGAGAKTAVGYGRFEPDERAQRELIQALKREG